MIDDRKTSLVAALSYLAPTKAAFYTSAYKGCFWTRWTIRCAARPCQTLPAFSPSESYNLPTRHLRLCLSPSFLHARAREMKLFHIFFVSLACISGTFGDGLKCKFTIDMRNFSLFLSAPSCDTPRAVLIRRRVAPSARRVSRRNWHGHCLFRLLSLLLCRRWFHFISQLTVNSREPSTEGYSVKCSVRGAPHGRSSDSALKAKSCECNSLFWLSNQAFGCRPIRTFALIPKKPKQDRFFRQFVPSTFFYNGCIYDVNDKSNIRSYLSLEIFHKYVIFR